jgi:hypothetical protein
LAKNDRTILDRTYFPPGERVRKARRPSLTATGGAVRTTDASSAGTHNSAASFRSVPLLRCPSTGNAGSAEPEEDLMAAGCSRRHPRLGVVSIWSDIYKVSISTQVAGRGVEPTRDGPSS